MKTFEARFRGRCATDCGRRIEVGDPVTYVDEELRHGECADTVLPPLTFRRPPCPKCFLVHAGECF